jgi:hypothetical protein
MRPACEQFAREPRVERVAGFVSDQTAQHRLADQCKVPEQIKSLVTNELIREPQRRIVQHPTLGEHNRIFQGSATDQAARLKFLDFVESRTFAPEQPIGIIGPRKFDVRGLCLPARMGEVDVVPDAERVGRIDAQRLLAIVEDELFSNSMNWGAILFNDADAR